MNLHIISPTGPCKLPESETRSYSSVLEVGEEAETVEMVGIRKKTEERASVTTATLTHPFYLSFK